MSLGAGLRVFGEKTFDPQEFCIDPICQCDRGQARIELIKARKPGRKLLLPCNEFANSILHRSQRVQGKDRLQHVAVFYVLLEFQAVGLEKRDAPRLTIFERKSIGEIIPKVGRLVLLADDAVRPFLKRGMDRPSGGRVNLRAEEQVHFVFIKHEFIVKRLEITAFLASTKQPIDPVRLGLVRRLANLHQWLIEERAVPHMFQQSRH
jgi:hypothetical protein